jgi:hypothetical protein
MPVYLTVPGHQSSTPWRSSTRVFAHPVEILPEDEDNPHSPEDGATTTTEDPNHPTTTTTTSTSSQSRLSIYHRSSAIIRRLRHSEVILVDDVCIAYGRYWLRLRWPGHRGGFAGYVALEKSSSSRTTTEQTGKCKQRTQNGLTRNDLCLTLNSQSILSTTRSSNNNDYFGTTGRKSLRRPGRCRTVRHGIDATRRTR